MLNRNRFLAKDTYKDGHDEMLPPEVESMTSYIEARAGREFGAVRFFGLQGYIKDYLDFNELNAQADFSDAFRLISEHGTRLPLWLLNMAVEHGLNLPLTISAVPEGMYVPAGVPLVKVRTTDPAYRELGGWLETQLIRGVWYPTSTCTRSFRMGAKLAAYYTATGADRANLPFALHDFGARGATSGESAAIGGAGHLVNFLGTDTQEALEWLRRHYYSDCAGFSILAAEHSVVQAWGRGREKEFFEMICHKFGKRPNCLISIPMDTYDQDAAFSLFSNELKPLVLETFGAGHGSKLVFRPDSGPPVENVVNYPLQLMNAYGVDNESREYRKLPPFLGLIQGDGIDEESLGDCLRSMRNNGIRADQCAFGSGGGLLQKVTRDTGGFAQKLCLTTQNGVEIPTNKQPKSDPSKASKAGDVTVVLNDDGIPEATTVQELRGRPEVMRVVYDRGNLVVDERLDDIRARASFG